MNSNQIFIGNIKRCTKYIMRTKFSTEKIDNGIYLGSDTFGCIEQKNIIEKENAILIKTKNGKYIDQDSYKTALDYFKIRQALNNSNNFGLGDLFMSTEPHCSDCLFVDESSLTPYYK